MIQEKKDTETVTTPQELLWRNEVQSNRFTSQLLVIFWLLNLLIGFLFFSGLYEMNDSAYLVFFGFISAVIIPSVLIAKCTHSERKWTKSMLITAILLCFGAIDTYLGYNIKLIFVLPIIVSIRYYSKSFTLSVSLASFLVLFISSILNALWGEIDLNMIDVVADTVLHPDVDPRESILAVGVDHSRLITSQIIYGFIPQSLALIVIAIVSTRLASRSQKLIMEQAEISAKSSQLETELTLASNIQSGLLPSVFPPFPERNEFDIFASMKPAKEIGGDFYDFFMIDDNHLALVIADVSGKGVPAALFMMISKALLKTQSQNGHSPAEVLTKVNNQLCENNIAEMFVTVWLGIYEVCSGKLTASNAGHEYPVIKKAGGMFELYKDKHAFVVAGMENTKYRDYEVQLEIGDTLFVYTDGLPEATNSSNQQFGYDRMLTALNEVSNASMHEILDKMHQSVDVFVDGANQFDDLTMLAFKRKK